jgi:hypothetical protein
MRDWEPVMDVLIAAGTEEEVAAIRHIVRGLDPSAYVQGPGDGVGIDPIAWIAITMPLSIFVKKFLDLAAADSYHALKAWVSRIAAAGRRPSSSIVVRDVELGRTIWLAPDLPDEAYRQLLRLHPEECGPGKHITYDPDRGSWTAPR